MRRVLGVALVVMVVGIAAFVSWDAPIQAQNTGRTWSCSLDNLGATLTLCASAQTIGATGTSRLYVTDIIAQSTTATAGQMLLRYGTGTNCGTGTVSLFPAAATAVRVAYPANTAAPTVIRLSTPLSVPPENDLCVLAVATNTLTVQIVGTVR